MPQRLVQARLVSYLLKGAPCEGIGAEILLLALPTACLWGPARELAVDTGKGVFAPVPERAIA